MARARAAGVALGLAALAAAPPALADLRICNQTGELQSIALGFKGAEDWSSKGWWNVQPGACATLVPGALTQRYYYYFADSRGGGFQGQDYAFCVGDSAFEIEGDTDCESRGHEALSFREIDTGETATSFTLTIQSSKTSSLGDAERVPGGGKSKGELATQTVTERPLEAPVTVDMADLTTTLPAGRHGQPFTRSALFQGCELENSRAYCSFHANGVKLRAFYGGPTPLDLLYALEELELNAPVEVTGDAVDQRGQERAVVVRAVRADPSGDRFARLRANLQGDWVSVADRMSEITIRGSELYVRYEGKFKAARFWSLEDRCAGHSGQGPVLVQVARGSSDQKCYRVADAAARLRLEPVKGGAALEFRRP